MELIERQLTKLRKQNKRLVKTILIIILLLIANIITTMGIVLFLVDQYQPDMVKVPIEVIEDLDYPPVPTEELKF